MEAEKMPPTDLALDPEKYASPVILVIDMQNEYCHREGWLQSRLGIDVGRGISIIPNVKKLVDFGRVHSVPIIFTRMSIRPDLLDAGLFPETRPPYREGGLREGTWGVDVVDELKPLPGEPVIDKHRFNAFLGTSLEQLLWGYKADSVIVAGVATHLCVGTTATDATQRGFRLVLLKDCTASYAEHFETAMFDIVESGFGKVMKSDAFYDYWLRRGEA
ncbi:MAG: cysteine hydrolase family protein [Thermoleophilia bacterium]